MLSKQDTMFYLQVKYKLNYMGGKGEIWCEIMDDLNFVLYLFFEFFNF